MSEASKPKWTPGPWRNSVTRIFDVNAEEVAVATRASPRNRPRAEANAHLIAAAPELYKALAAMAHHHQTSPLIGLARAALAKARGEQS